MNLAGYDRESIVNGDGMRATLYFSGCVHHCKGCFNAPAWNFSYGEPFTRERQLEIIAEIADNPLLDGVTLCGGDPFCSAREVADFVRLLKEHLPDMHIWAYTGYTYEEVLTEPDRFELLQLCDTLVDGRFVLEEKDLTLRFRGSRNQRIIDVRKSLASGAIHVIDM